VALTLERRGITRIRPLEGGFPEWRNRGYPVELVKLD
jgi:3-mercaptopyruvate sulfurtransferase SseA